MSLKTQVKQPQQEFVSRLQIEDDKATQKVKDEAAEKYLNKINGLRTENQALMEQNNTIKPEAEQNEEMKNGGSGS